MSATINFTADIPHLGDAIVVKENHRQAQAKYIRAKNQDRATLTLTKGDGKEIVIPTHLVGPIEER